jgi:hypothetical protein
MPIIRNNPSEKTIHGKLVMVSDTAVVSDNNFTTKGEGVIIIKNVESCTIRLDHTTTEKTTIKALTKVIILPLVGLIDDEYDEIFIDKGACVEFAYCAGGWYILSSDGLKIS